MDDHERLMRTLCMSSLTGFCSHSGEHFGCKNGRGESPSIEGCKAPLGTLLLSDEDTVARVVAENFILRPKT